MTSNLEYTDGVQTLSNNIKGGHTKAAVGVSSLYVTLADSRFSLLLSPFPEMPSLSPRRMLETLC